MKLKRVVIKEELVELTKDFKCAIILNQMIYWSERVKDFDKFIKEEKVRIATTIGKEVTDEEIEEDLMNGWIYKTSEELSEECMLGASPSTIRRYLTQLIDNNWLSERTNPKYKWDKTKQYRVNIAKIQQDLFKLGYFLEGYPLQMAQLSNFQNEKSNVQNEKSNVQNEKAIPEITSKTTTKTNNIYSEIISYLNEKANTKYRASTKATKDIINARLNDKFTLEDFKTVIDNKCDSWVNTEYEKYIRPATLFGTKFESYLNEKPKKKPTQVVKPSNTPAKEIINDDYLKVLEGEF